MNLLTLIFGTFSVHSVYYIDQLFNYKTSETLRSKTVLRREYLERNYNLPDRRCLMNPWLTAGCGRPSVITALRGVRVAGNLYIKHK